MTHPSPSLRQRSEFFGLALQKNGVEVDPDPGPVMARLVNPKTGAVMFERQAARMDVGRYEIEVLAQDAPDPGAYVIVWLYVMDGVDETYETHIVLGEPQPDYEALPPDMQTVVENVWFRFGDLFDSPHGGANLQTYFQTHYSRNRVAQLLRVALGLLNTTAQPFQTYTLDGVGARQFPVGQWGALLESALYVEVLKHLVRSYVEQPAFVGGNVARLDRRDYMDRWRSILEEERQQLKSQMDVFKIMHMGLGKPKVLVSGGVYGRYGPNRLPYSAVARPRYWTRMY